MQVWLCHIIEVVHNNVLKCAFQSLEGILNRFCNMIQYDTIFNVTVDPAMKTLSKDCKFWYVLILLPNSYNPLQYVS